MTPHQRRLRKAKRKLRRAPRSKYLNEKLAAGSSLKEAKREWGYHKLGMLISDPIFKGLQSRSFVREIFSIRPQKPPLGQRTEAKRLIARGIKSLTPETLEAGFDLIRKELA
jgi:hypothetical protein